MTGRKTPSCLLTYKLATAGDDLGTRIKTTKKREKKGQPRGRKSLYQNRRKEKNVSDRGFLVERQREEGQLSELVYRHYGKTEVKT